MKHIDRHGSFSTKVDALKQYYGREDLTPLWVADMDFETPVCVKEALQKVLDQGVYGYNHVPGEYYPTIINWLEQQQGWSVKREWLTFIPGIVKGIGYVINFFTNPGDGIVVMPPVYPPFINVPKGNGREVIFNPLIRTESGYEMDFIALEKILIEGQSPEVKHKPKVLILCNPHNPGGIVWGKECLVKLAQLCKKYGIIVISDEIHADMPLYGGKHLPFASVSDEAASISITFGAPSKTFNMAGIVSSYAIVPNKELREKFYHWMEVNELSSPTIFATLGAIAAYKHGLPWRDEMLKYLEGNIAFVEEFLAENYNTMLIKPLRPQSSFLIWLDCRELCANKLSGDKTQQQLVELFVNKAKLALNDGAAFGPGGEGYMRLNIGCGREVIEEALGNLKKCLLSL